MDNLCMSVIHMKANDPDSMIMQTRASYSEAKLADGFATFCQNLITWRNQHSHNFDNHLPLTTHDYVPLQYSRFLNSEFYSNVEFHNALYPCNGHSVCTFHSAQIFPIQN